MNNEEKMRLLRQLRENELRRDLLVPLLNRMGLRAVCEYHGPRENGKDVVCFDIDRLKRRRYLINGDRVSKLRGGNSHRMIAFDVIGLVGLFLESWDSIQGKTALEVSELEAARATANRLVAAVGLREQAPAQRSAAAIVRQKAYTLLVRAYNETRQAVAFVRRAQGDVDDIVPSLYAGRGKRPPEPPIVIPEPTPPVVVPPEVPAPGNDNPAEAPAGAPGTASSTQA